MPHHLHEMAGLTGAGLGERVDAPDDEVPREGCGEMLLRPGSHLGGELIGEGESRTDSHGLHDQVFRQQHMGSPGQSQGEG